VAIRLLIVDDQEPFRAGCPSGGGINTGKFIAGTIGGGGRLQYTVIGDSVNIAARLQGEANGGEILATSATVAGGPDVRAVPVGPVMVKGRHEPVDVCRVVG
jgi:class 3 adenylate cyclase